MSTDQAALRGISSMATRRVLAQLAQQHEAASGQAVEFESIGGVKAEARVMDGEVFDVVVLASGAMKRLAKAGKIDADTLSGVVNSAIAVAVAPGRPAFDPQDEQAIRTALTQARTVGYSTGPSGDYIVELLGRWGFDTSEAARSPRLVQARPGVPVGTLVAQGEVDIGFQQVSELTHVQGIQLLGLLPDSIQKTTTFSAAVATVSPHAEAARAFVKFLVSPAAVAAKEANGMTAA